MLKKYKIWFISIILLLAIVPSLGVFTFNPITNFNTVSQIKQLARTIANTDIKNEKLPLNLAQQDYIAVKGIQFQTNQQGHLIVSLPIGFDNQVNYDYHNNCWYGNVTIVLLAACTSSSF